jgi:hypothetical protein
LTPRAKVPTIEKTLPQLRRGDSNADGKLDTSDGIYSLNWQSLGGAAPGCLYAAHSNDDGGVDVGDTVSIFNFLFLGGPPPPPPGSSVCGPDLTDDDLDCAIKSAVCR